MTWVASALDIMDDVLTPMFTELVVNTDSFCCCVKTVVVKPLLVESKMAAEENVVVKWEELIGADGFELTIVLFPVAVLATILLLLEMAENRKQHWNIEKGL